MIHNFFLQGGIVAIPLLILSILVVAVTAERIFFWLRISIRQGKAVRQALNAYRRVPEIGVRKLKDNANLPACRIFLEALMLEDATPDEFRLALESASYAEFPHLQRFSTTFDFIVAAAPVLGLLGTIIGLIKSFAALDIGSIGGEGTLEVTGGISEALVSTAIGLTVALFALLFANLFRGLYLRQLDFIQEYGTQLELIYRRRFQRISQPPEVASKQMFS